MEVRQYNIKTVVTTEDSLPETSISSNSPNARTIAKSLDSDVAYSPSTDDVIVRVNVQAGSNPSVSVATLDRVGTVKPDGETITIDPDGTIHADVSSCSNLENGEGVGSIKSSSTSNYDGTPYDTDEKKIEATGHESFAFGRGCKATGTRSYSYGSYNESGGNCSYVIGQNNTATENANRGFVGGYKNVIDNNTTFAFGQGLINSRERKATFGQWNYDEYDTLLEVGCGTSDSDRRNAFEVRTNGLTIMNNRAKVYGVPQEDTDVVRKLELDEKQDKLTAGNNITIVDGVISASGGGSGGTTDLTDYVKKTDYATSGKGGVVMVSSSYGMKMSNGYIMPYPAADSTIEGLSNNYQAIVPKNLRKAVKEGLVKNNITLTDTEKATVCSWLGAASSAQVGDIETALDSIIAIQNSILGGNA